jgi:hypothetical protein
MGGVILANIEKKILKMTILIMASMIFMFLLFAVHTFCKRQILTKSEKPILPIKMMKGYRLEVSNLYDEEPGDDALYYWEVWRNRKETEGFISVGIKVYKNKRDAIAYVEGYKKMWRNKPDLFDKSFGEKQTMYLSKKGFELLTLFFVKDNVAVDITGRPPYGDPPSNSLEFFEKVARYIESKI